MKPFAIATIVLTAGLACSGMAPAAMAKTTHKAPAHKMTTAELNRWQLTKAQSDARTDAQPPVQIAAAAPAETAPTTVLVTAPPRDSTDAARSPDTNPQSAGTPSTDAPYAVVIPKQ